MFGGLPLPLTASSLVCGLTQLCWLQKPTPHRPWAELSLRSPKANPFLGLRSVLHPNQGWATPISCLCPRSPDPFRPPGQALALPLSSHPSRARPGGPGVWITCRRLSEACGLSSSAGSILSRRPRACCPEEEVTDTQNKTCGIPDLSACSLAQPVHGTAPARGRGH